MLRSAILLVGLWWALTGGDPGSWAVGVPSIGAALAARRRLRPGPASRISAVGAARFLSRFLRQSFWSGVDVVRRAVHPRLPLAPALIEETLRLGSPAERILVAGTLNLLPGTLSTDLSGTRLTLHVLDRDAPVRRELEEIQALAAGLLAAPRPPTRSSGGSHDPE